MIYLAPLIEHSSEAGGKGGPEQKVFNYTQTIAIGLCERVDDFADASKGAIGGITRIWENGQLAYDIRPQQHANTSLGHLAETDAEYATRLSISADYAETFTLYIGTETQDPDPTLESVEGMGNVPGFRGLAYVVYPNRQLQEGQGLRHPNFTFECYQDGTGSCFDQNEYSNDALYPWFDEGNIYNYNLQLVSQMTYGTTGPSPAGNNYSSIAALFAANRGYTNIDQSTQIGYTVPESGMELNADPLVPLAGSVAIGASLDGVTVDPTLISVHYNFTMPSLGLQPGQPAPPSLYSISGSQWWQFDNSAAGNQFGITLTTGNNTGAHDLDFPYQQQSKFEDSPWIEGISDLVVTQTRNPGPPPPPCQGLMAAAVPGYAIDAEGNLVKCNQWVLDTSQDYKVLQSFLAQTGTGGVPANFTTRHPLNPCLPVADPNYSSESFWTAAYAAALAAGDPIASGLTYGVDYPVVQAHAWALDSVVCQGSGAEANVADVISAICQRAGLAADQIEVSDLAEVSVAGYSISGICDAADIISPLRSIAFFDCVESGNQLRFPTRGKEIVATLTEDQFGCFDGDLFGEASQVPPKVTVTRADETTLPRSIRLHYKAVSRDYQDGEQDSPSRLTTKAVDDQDISIPLCIGDTQALQAAEINWSDAWAAQNTYTISIDQSLLELEGADCIGVPVDGFVTRMRITNESNASGVLRKLTLVGDSEGSYISFAEAQPPQRPPQQLQLVSPSRFALLNIPAIRDADNDSGFYVVAWPDPAIGNQWRGAQLFQSVDGDVFTPSVSALTAATVGTVHASVPASEAFDFDTSTILTIDCDKSQSFASRSDAAVLSGANAAVMGANGRWEVIQFANASQISATQWQLSRLLRGRRGTEHVIGSSIAGDQFILISTGDIVRVAMSPSQIGASYVYKMVSNGTSLAAADAQDFASSAEALVCFSPVNASAAMVGSDILIRWTRRSRQGRTLMSGVDIPLGEASESYSIDIIAPDSPSSPEVVLRTLSSGAHSVTYTAAQIAADFGSAPSSIKIAIFQLSAIVGRGTPFTGTLIVT